MHRTTELSPHDLLRTAIVSKRGVPGLPIVAAKKLLRRLLGPFVLGPQTQFNQDVAASLAAQRDQLVALTSAPR